MRKRLAGCVVVACAVCAGARGGESAEVGSASPSPRRAAPADPPPEGEGWGGGAPEDAAAGADEAAVVAVEDAAAPLYLEVSLRYESGYFFRGIAQRPDSNNFQPAATLYFTLVDEEGLWVGAVGGVWANFSDETAPGSSDSWTEHWYEVDYLAGVAVEVDRLTITALYDWYESPSSDFEGTQDATVTLAWNDLGQWDEQERFALNPGAAVAVDTVRAASGEDGGVWVGLGVRPTLNMGGSPLGDVAVSFPTGVGLGFSDYYQTDSGESSTFGYFETGVNLRFDPTVREGSAAPAFDVGVRFLFLGDAAEEINDGDGQEVVFTAGLLWRF